MYAEGDLNYGVVILKMAWDDEQRKRLCELVGIIIGDGCIGKYMEGTKVHYVVGVCGDPKKEVQYLSKYIAALFEEFAGGKPSVFYHERALWVKTQKKKLFDLLTTEIGLRPGKKAAIVCIPHTILDQGWDYVKYTIRGIADTDGSVFTADKPGSPAYPSIEITTVSENLAEQLYLLLKKEKFRVTKRGFERKDGPTVYKVGLNGYNMMRKWHTEIGFSNPRKSQKLLEIVVGQGGFEPPASWSSAMHFWAE